MNSILSFVVLLVFLTINTHAIFLVRPSGQLVFFHDQIKSINYAAGEEICKLIGGQYPKLESKEDVDELSEIVMKHKKIYSGFWIPLKEDDKLTFTWTDGSPYNTSLAKRVIENGNDCMGPKCRFLFDANKKNILGTSTTQTTNVMCVISNFKGNEQGRQGLESLETQIKNQDVEAAKYVLKFKQHVGELLDMEDARKQSRDGIQETLKKLRNLLRSN